MDTESPDALTKIHEKDLQALNAYYATQLNIEREAQKHNNTLLAQFDIKKDIATSVVDIFKRTSELDKLVQKAGVDELRETQKLATIQDETKRKEQKTIIESIQQRKVAGIAEMEMLQAVQKSGFLPIIFLLGKAWSLFKSLDKAAADFRMKMGMTRDTTGELRKMAESVSIEFMHVGVNIEGAYEAMTSLSTEMGSVYTVSKDLVKTTAVLKAQLGVSSETTSGFLAKLGAISNATMDTQENMSYVAANMSQAAGVPLSSVMGDVAKASGHTLTMMSRVPSQVIRSAVELRKMGTSLEKAATSSRELLNFTDSMNAEMEASVLLGKSVNFQTARELAYKRDLEGSTKEILRLTKSVNFEKLDVFQQEAFAKATGKSVDELLKMTQADREWSKARRSSDPEVKAMVKRYEEMRQHSKAQVMTEADKLKLMIEQKANQDRMTAVSAKWNQLITKVAYKILPAIDNTLEFVIDHFESLVAFGGSLLLFGHKIAGVFTSIGIRISSWATHMEASANAKNWKWIANMYNGIVRLGVKIKSIGEMFAGWGPKITNVLKMLRLDKFLGMFQSVGNKIGSIFSSVLGKVLMPVMFLWNIFKGIKDLLNDKKLMSIDGFWNFNKALIGRAVGVVWKAFSDLFFGIPGLILKGLGSIVTGIANALMAGFHKAYDYLEKMWIGHSPSGIALLILKGIRSVGGMMYDSLIDPFRRGLAWIVDKIPGMGKFAAKIRGDKSDLMAKPRENQMAGYVSAVTVTPNTTTVAGMSKANTPTSNKGKDEKDGNTTLQDILVAINTLNKNLEAGKIGFHVDGQLLSATIARQTEFRGGFGTNKI